jgi:hypothetical protein
MTTLATVTFLPSLGMVWRGMWSLAYVPPPIDDSSEADTPDDV